MTLTEFLLARIAEDEQAANHAGSHPDSWGVMANDTYGHLLVQPSRVLAECESKRQVVDIHRPNDLYNDGKYVTCEECGDLDASPAPHPCYTLRWLALPYADHSDFQPEWKP